MRGKNLGFGPARGEEITVRQARLGHRAAAVQVAHDLGVSLKRHQIGPIRRGDGAKGQALGFKAKIGSHDGKDASNEGKCKIASDQGLAHDMSAAADSRNRLKTQLLVFRKKAAEPIAGAVGIHRIGLQHRAAHSAGMDFRRCNQGCKSRLPTVIGADEKAGQ